MRVKESDPTIELRGVRVHNLKGIDLSLPLDRLIVITGVSGSGKSSLAFDTLFAEGQRRYLESFSPSSRQWVTRLEKPDADRIDHIPPAIAVRQESPRSAGGRATLATVAEIHDSLRLLFARLGRIICPGCGREIRSETPQSVAAQLNALPAGTRFQVAFLVPADPASSLPEASMLDELRQAGFVRAVHRGTTVELSELGGSSQKAAVVSSEGLASIFLVIVDRLAVGKANDARLHESLATAVREGDGACAVLVDGRGETAVGAPLAIDGQPWGVLRFREDLLCDTCSIAFLPPEPRLFSFQSPLGACPRCHGLGTIARVAPEALLDGTTLRETITAAARSTTSRTTAEALIASLAKSGVDVDQPTSDLSAGERQQLLDGVKKGRKKPGGLAPLIADLEERQHQPGVRTLLRTWRRTDVCPDCRGERLQPAALAVQLPEVSGLQLNIADFCRQTADEAARFLESLRAGLPDEETRRTEPVLRSLRSRLETLSELGIGDIPLERPPRMLSAGESRRATVAAVLGTSLVHALYVFDEPTAGLHPDDVDRVLPMIARLRDAPNTVVVVEHEEAFLRAADHVVEIGPGAGSEGGRVTFAGPYVPAATPSVDAKPPRRVRTPSGWLRLGPSNVHNLRDLTVDIPLGTLCVVTGVSGAGKSSLVAGSLEPAVRRFLNRPATPGEAAISLVLLGEDGSDPRTGTPSPIDDAILVDQSPLPRSQRSTPATCLKIFDLIRKQFAETADAQVRNYGPQHFSFNAAGGGRCSKCEGTGVLRIDMQFLADVTMPCPECRGARFQREILDIRWRGMNIAEVMALTLREAFSFFSRHPKIVRRLQPLRDVGLDYLPLGQPVTTLSGGECRRLKLAIHLAGSRRSRTLFLLDEPTTGLHRRDTATLLACFDALLAVGHSLVVIEHDQDLIRAADWVIDLGPGSGAQGGRVVFAGPPGELAKCEESRTGVRLCRQTL